MSTTAVRYRSSSTFRPGRIANGHSASLRNPMITFGVPALIAIAFVLIVSCLLDVFQGSVDSTTQTEMSTIASVAKTVDLANGTTPLSTHDLTVALEDADLTSTVTVLAASAKGFCLSAYNPDGARYFTSASGLTFDSVTGGTGRTVGACSGVTFVP